MTRPGPGPAADPPATRPPDPEGLRYARYWEPVLASAAHRLLDRIAAPPPVVLDVGAGTGSLTLAASRRWPEARLIGLDASAGMLSVARRRARAASSTDAARLTWLVADAADMPLADGSVDVAVSSFLLQLVPDRASVLREVHRVLRPGGTFAFVTWLAEELVMPADQVYEAVLAELGLEADDEDAGFRPAGATEYGSPDEARLELLAAGFSDVEAWPTELHARWSRTSYLEFKESFDDVERFDGLDVAGRERLRAMLRTRWAELPESAFELRGPLVGALARKSPGSTPTFS